MLYNQPFARRFGTDLIELLNSGEWTSVDIAVAWVRESGLRHLRNSLESFLRRGGNLRFVVGVDLDNTSKEGLAALLSLESIGAASTYINHNEAGAVFHPKLYLFRNDEAAKLIVGSNNITEAGLFRNTEAGLQVECKPNDTLVNDVLGAIDSWCDTATALARRLDGNLLIDLESSGYVRSEAVLKQALRQRQSAARTSHGPALFGSAVYTAPSFSTAPAVAAANSTTGGASASSAGLSSMSVQSTGGRVLIMRIRTARGTQTQMPMRVIASSFFDGYSTVRSLHDGQVRGVHQAHANGKVNTLKLEIPETASMSDPMIRFERTSSGIQYQVWDKGSTQGGAIWTSLEAGRNANPPTTFLTKPSNPDQSTWWRFI